MYSHHSFDCAGAGLVIIIIIIFVAFSITSTITLITHPCGMCHHIMHRHHMLGQMMCNIICHHLFRCVTEALHPIISISYLRSCPLLYKAFSCCHATPAVQVARGSCGFPTLLFLSPALWHPTTLLELMSPYARWKMWSVRIGRYASTLLFSKPGSRNWELQHTYWTELGTLWLSEWGTEKSSIVARETISWHAWQRKVTNTLISSSITSTDTQKFISTSTTENTSIERSCVFSLVTSLPTAQMWVCGSSEVRWECLPMWQCVTIMHWKSWCACTHQLFQCVMMAFCSHPLSELLILYPKVCRTESQSTTQKDDSPLVLRSALGVVELLGPDWPDHSSSGPFQKRICRND